MGSTTVLPTTAYPKVPHLSPLGTSRHRAASEPKNRSGAGGRGLGGRDGLAEVALEIRAVQARPGAGAGGGSENESFCEGKNEGPPPPPAPQIFRLKF